MIRHKKDGVWTDADSILDGIGISAFPAPVVSVIGGGGKTTTIKRIAQEYRHRKQPVIMMTTTHMLIENEPWILLNPTITQIKDTLVKEGIAWVGTPTQNGKMTAISKALFQEILKIGCPILIEADGARRLPMKAPAEHEPVIWAETTHVLNVYGLDTLGKKLEDVCFRAELAATLLNKEVTDVVECFDIAKLAQLSAVESKGVLPKMRYHIVLNKADTDALFEQAKQIANLLEENAISELTVTSRSEIQPCEEVLEE